MRKCTLHYIILWLLLPILAGCWALPPQTPAQQSKYGLGSYFKDPKAQQLALAAEQGNAEEVRRLMKQEGVNPDQIFSEEGTPLLVWPIIAKSPAGLRAMLESGADPNAQKPGRKIETFKDGSVANHALYRNAMILAAEQEDPIYLKILLDHGGDPNGRNLNGESLLFHAYIHQNLKENVKLLVERGADVNAQAQIGTIAEHYAMFANFEMIYWLLQHGADPSLTYYRGKPVKRPDSAVIETIFWYPSRLHDPVYQRKSQQWLLAHGYQRPPMPKYLRDLRRDCGEPTEEKDIPLVVPAAPPLNGPSEARLCQPRGAKMQED